MRESILATLKKRKKENMEIRKKKKFSKQNGFHGSIKHNKTS